MHHDIVMPKDPVQEESVIEPEVKIIASPALQMKFRKRTGVLKTPENSFFETNAALMEKVRKLELKVKRLQRALTEALTSQNIALIKLKRCENKLTKEIWKHLRK